MKATNKTMWDVAEELGFELTGTGFVYWGATCVEHYTLSCFEDLDKLDASLRKLRARIEHLYDLGVPLNGNTVVWYSSWFEGATRGGAYLKILAKTPYLWEHTNEHNPHLAFASQRGRDNRLHIFYASGDHSVKEVPWDVHDYHAMVAKGYQIPQAGQPEHNGLVYATYPQMVALLSKYLVPCSPHDIMM